MPKFWNLTPDKETPADGVLDIEGEICADDWFGNGTSSRKFREALKGVGNVTVHINSPGGDVLAGAEIYSALREHSLNGKGRVKVIVTALAASAASVVAMAGDEILISPVAYMMIHNPWTVALGDARDMRKTAKTLDEIREGLITAYQQRTGKTREELQRMLDSETWMSAQRCVDEGFADGIYGGEIRAAALAGGSGIMTGNNPEKVREMIARYQAAKKAAGEEDPEKDPEKDPEEDPEEPEQPEREPEGAEPEEPEEDPEEDPEQEPEGAEPEEPEQDPEEPGEPEADPEENPEEDPDEDPEEEEPEKARRKARNMAARAIAMAKAQDSWMRAEKATQA